MLFMPSFIPILLPIAAALYLSDHPAQSEPASRGPGALAPFPGAGTVEIQLSTFTAPEQSLPPNGHVRPPVNASERSGHQVDMRVPFGTYVVKYASGQKWYGYQHLFGPDTAYNKADQMFAFRREGNQIKGFSITLYAVPGGNVSSLPINSKDF